MSGPARGWDGAAYDRLSTPMQAMGLEVLARLPLAGNETVIDAGCGSGRVTEALAGRLPGGRVIGVDGSASMVEAARRRLGDAVELHVADLLELDLGVRADAILSTATFHWIGDHDRLFARLRAHLQRGGRLEAQCGGRGNVQSVVDTIGRLAATQPWAPHLADVAHPWRFSGPEEAERLLRAAGFDEVRCWLEQRDAKPPDMRAFVRSSVVPLQLDRLPERLHESFLDAVMEELGEPDSLAYVRLNLSARRPR